MNLMMKNIYSILKKYKYFILFLIIGLLIFCYPMLKSNFDLMPGDSLDVKLFTYILEHSFLWLIKTPSHFDFWSAPFFYPFENNLAFSDVTLIIMPFYWFLRIFFEPFSALQALLIVLCVLNYSTFYYLLARQFKYCDLASSVGAFIFAFGLMRYFKMVHLNYYAQFATILSLIFLLKVNKNNSKLKNNFYFALFVLFLALQFYSCYLQGYCFCLVGLLGVIISLYRSDLRKEIFEFFKNFYIYIIGYFALFIILLLPLALKYLDVGVIRTIDEINLFLQNQFAWIRSQSILDNLFLKNLALVDFYDSKEFCASSGIITTLISIFAISKMKKLRGVLYFLLIFIFLTSCSVNSFCLWHYLYNILPGATGIRVIVRICFIALIIISFGLAHFIQYLQNKKENYSKIILIISILFILIEQIPYYNDPNSAWENYSWSKSEFISQIDELSAKIPKDEKIVYFELDYNNKKNEKLANSNREIGFKSVVLANLLIMWATMKNNQYTLNGFSGIEKHVDDYRDYGAYKMRMIIDLDSGLNGGNISYAIK